MASIIGSGIGGSSDDSFKAQPPAAEQPEKLTVGPAGLPVQFQVGPAALAGVMQPLGERGAAISARIPGTSPVEDVGVSVPGKIGYWENPQRVARYYNAFRAAEMGKGDAPPWIDRDSIDTAYKYLEFRNSGKPWYRWQPLAEDDPGTAYLRSLTAPPAELLPDWEQKEAEWSLADAAAYQPPEVAPGTQATFGVSDADWDKLPAWQKAVIPLMSSGKKFGAVLGGGLGLAGGPVGAAAGAAVGYGLGAAADYASANPNTLAARAFNWITNAAPDANAPASGLLDWGAEIPKRLMGLALQAGYAVVDPEKYGTLGEIINNLPQAWQAANLTYIVSPSNPLENLRYMAASLGMGQEDYRQRVWNLGQAEPILLTEEQVGAAALAEARQRLMTITNGQNNETLEDVFQDMRNRFGFTGQRHELMGMMLIDLYNLIPFGGAQVIGDLAKAANNPRLKAASILGEGRPIDVAKAYKQAIQQAPINELSKFEKWFGGVTELPGGRAAPEFLAQPGRSAFDLRRGRLWINELTPASKAYETTVMFRDNANMLIHEAQSVDEVQKLLHLAANGKPAEIAQVANASWLNSADGGVFPVMMRDHVKLVDEFADNFRISDNKRVLINNLADILEIKPNKLVDQINDAKGADDYINVLQSKLDDLARGGNAKAADLLRAINDPANPLTGAKLYNIASDFKRGNFPLTFDEWKYKLVDALSERVEKSAVDWFGVKPDPYLIRLGNVVKSAQSLLLLGLNPSYLANNLISNLNTMAHSGTLGLESFKAQTSFISRFIPPTRLSVGIGGAAEIGGEAAKAGELGSAIRAATKPAKVDTLTKLDDLLRTTANKFGLATKYSAKVEQWSSRIAYTTAMRNAFRNTWRRGVGFSGMDNVLAKALRDIGVEPDSLYRMVEGGLNWKEIEDNFASGYKLESLDRALDPEVKTMFNELGLYDTLADKLKNATTRNEIVRALDEVKGEAFSAIQKRLAANEMARKVQAGNRVTGEGMQAALEIWDRNWIEHIDFWNSHHDKMGHVFEVANQLTGKNRSKYLAQELAKADETWRAQWEVFNAKTQGVIDALRESGDNVTTQTATDILINQRQNWAVFYDTRSKLYNLLSDAVYQKDQGALNELNRALTGILDDDFVPNADVKADLYGYYQDAIKLALNREYRNVMSIESGLQVELDALFVDLFGRQFANAEAASAWRAGIMNLREMMAEANIYFRTGDASGLSNFGDERLALKAQIDRLTGGQPVDRLSPADRHAMYRKFYEQVVKPMQTRYMQENMVNAGAMTQTPPRDVPIPPAPVSPVYPAIAPGITLEKVNYSVMQRIKTKEGFNNDKHIVNAVNKYLFNGKPEKKKIGDITWKELSDMLKKRRMSIDVRKIDKAYWKDVNQNTIEGSRSNFEKQMPKPIADYLSSSFESEARAMLDELPGADQAVVVVKESPDDVGGWRMSQNPPWYRKLFKELKENGKSLSRKSVESALTRIIEGNGKDSLRPNDFTIQKIKNIIWDRLEEQGDPFFELLAMPDIGKALTENRIDDAVSTFDAWITSDFASEFTDTDWAKITGGKFEEMLDLWQKRAEGQPAEAVEMPAASAPKALLVDENDKPIVVRHFTDAEFDIFDKSKLGMNTLENANDYYLGLTSLLGFWFTDSDIKIYKRSVSANLEMNNPLHVEDLDELSYLVKEKLANKAGVDIDDPNAEFFIKANLSEMGIKESDVINELVDDIRLEHDGIIVDSDEEFGGTSYIVFDPEQIVRTDIEKFSETIAQAPEPEAMKLPLGEVEKHTPHPIDEAALEGWNTMVEPAMRDLENKLLTEGMTQTGGFADQVRAGLKRAHQDWSDAEVTAAANDILKQVRAWLGTVKNQLGETKLASLKWGQEARDFSLLNYNRRTNFDTFFGIVFPYQFWYTRSMLNWALRAIDRPAIFANYARLKEFQQGTVEREGFPTRLTGKIGIRLPFLPEWMGDGVFVDPYRLIFSFSQFGRPVTELAEQNNLVYRKTVSTLQDMAADEEITPEQAQEAIAAGSGEIWDRATARAKKDIDLEIANPFDAMTLMYGPSLPIQYAYQLAMGRPERISQLPITRGVQAVTGFLGIGGPAGINIGGKIRKAYGLPEVDRFYDYRVDRMLASMAAMGAPVEDIKAAMLERQGPLFEEAQRKVSQLGFWQYIGAPLGVDFFPEGEEDQRALRSEYSRAIEAWKNGDDNALTKFYDQYPEYEAQKMAWQSDPEERLRMFLRAEVWDGWNKLSDLHKEQVKEQFGSTFSDAFVNKETRSYDSIDTATYALWARALGGDAAGVQAGEFQLRLAEQSISDQVQAFKDEERQLFPEYYKIYDTPEEQRTQKQNETLDAHTKWKQDYVSRYPQIAQYVTSEQSNLYGLPPEVQAYVYQYRNEIASAFPNIYETQSQYYELPAGTARKNFLKKHPELQEYWDTRTQWAAQMPTAAPYILGEESLSKRIAGDNAVIYNNKPAQIQVTAQDLEGFDPALTRQLFGWAFSGQLLTNGAMNELKRQWRLAGEPGGNFEKYLAAVRDAVGK